MNKLIGSVLLIATIILFDVPIVLKSKAAQGPKPPPPPVTGGRGRGRRRGGNSNKVVIERPPNPRWVSSSEGQSVPSGAVIGGQANGFGALYVCRASVSGEMHPGKLVAGKCNVAYGGKELILTQYQVLVGSGSWGKNGPAGAFVGGQAGEFTLYVCRVNYGDKGMHPGKVVSGKCNFAYGGQELASADFEYFYPTR